MADKNLLFKVLELLVEKNGYSIFNLTLNPVGNSNYFISYQRNFIKSIIIGISHSPENVNHFIFMNVTQF